MRNLIKKICILVVFLMVSIANLAFAEENSKILLSTNVQNIKKGDTFSVYVTQKIPGGILGMSADVEYSSTLLNLKNVNVVPDDQGNNVWTNMSDGNAIAAISSEPLEIEKVLELVFVAKDDIGKDSTQVKLNNVKYQIENPDKANDEIEVDAESVVLSLSVTEGTSGDTDQENPSQGENEQSETQPSDNTPSESDPSDNKPTDNKPTDNNPTDNNPTDNKPTDNKPSDNTPADNKPTDNKPADNKSVNNKQVGNNEINSNNNITNKTSLPKTGKVGLKTFFVILGIGIFGAVMYLQYKKYKEI